MSKNKFAKQIEKFSSSMTIVATLCSRYTTGSLKPFLDAAQVYNENYRSSTEFQRLLQAHYNLMQGSIGICNRLFDNYEAAKQNAIYDWSKRFFAMLDAAKRIIDEAYRLAYTVGRTDSVTTNLIEKEENPLVTIHRKIILEDGEFNSYKKTMFDWKCSVGSLYVEEQYMKHLVEMCNSRQSKFNPREAKLNKCTLRRTITIPDNDFETTPQICVLNAELMTNKLYVEQQEKTQKLTTDDLDKYILIYGRYQRELITFVFSNFLYLYNEKCVQCIKIFLEQQHSIIFNLLQRRKQLIADAREKITDIQHRDNVAWASDIDKTNTTITSGNSCGISNGNFSGSCGIKPKVVGSLE